MVVYIQFLSLLVAYSSWIAAAVLCLMPDVIPSVLECCCSAGSADLLVLGSSDSHSCFCWYCLSTVLGSYSPIYTVSLAMHAGIAFWLSQSVIGCC